MDFNYSISTKATNFCGKGNLINRVESNSLRSSYLSKQPNKYYQEILTNIYIMNDTISKNGKLSNIINLLVEHKGFNRRERELLIKFTGTIEDINQNKCTVNDSFKREEVKELSKIVEEQNNKKIELNREFEEIKEQYENLFLKLQNENNYKMFSLSLKYKPQSASQKDIEKAKFVLKAFDTKDEKLIEENLAYMDLSESSNNLLNYARQYGMTGNSFSVEKAGEYILCAIKYNKMIKQIENNDLKAFTNIINRVFIDKDSQKDYPKAYKAIKIYMQLSDTVKSGLLKSLAEKEHISSEELERIITNLNKK